MNGVNASARTPLRPRKSPGSKFCGLNLSRSTEQRENNAADAKASTVPGQVVCTALADASTGAWQATKQQPRKQRITPMHDHRLNLLSVSNKEKRNVKTEDVDESTVLVATEVCNKLTLYIHCEQTQSTPTEQDILAVAVRVTSSR